jgi:hypothetical protein
MSRLLLGKALQSVYCWLCSPFILLQTAALAFAADRQLCRMKVSWAGCMYMHRQACQWLTAVRLRSISRTWYAN